jgi:tetratricopeptide (TPR) repeat protein
MKYHPYVAGVFDEAAQINWAQPHNDFLWIFAEKGVIGFLAFAGFFIALIFASLKIIWKSEQSEYRNIALVLFGGVVGYIIISMFAFPYERINHQVYLSMISAGILATYARAFPFRALPLPGKLVSSFIAAAGIWGFIYGYNAVQQEMSLRRMFEYMNANNYKKAIQFANESRNPYRRVDFSSSVADYYISNAYYKDKQLDSAIVYCQKALEIFPENVVYANQMGKYLFEKKEYAKSLEYFKKAYKILTRDRKIFTNMAICNYQLGDYEEALRILENAPDHLKDEEIKARIEILENLIQEKKNKALPDQ